MPPFQCQATGSPMGKPLTAWQKTLIFSLFSLARRAYWIFNRHKSVDFSD
jgi:hypothetical protein